MKSKEFVSKLMVAVVAAAILMLSSVPAPAASTPVVINSSEIGGKYVQESDGTVTYYADTVSNAVCTTRCIVDYVVVWSVDTVKDNAGDIATFYDQASTDIVAGNTKFVLPAIPVRQLSEPPVYRLNTIFKYGLLLKCANANIRISIKYRDGGEDSRRTR